MSKHRKPRRSIVGVSDFIQLSAFVIAWIWAFDAFILSDYVKGGSLSVVAIVLLVNYVIIKTTPTEVNANG